MENKKYIFSETRDLDKTERENFVFVKDRIEDLQKSRENIGDINLEDLWSAADKEYTPHNLKSKGKKVVAEDELKGWRGKMVDLKTSDSWRSDASQPNVYVKIQIALGLLVDRNPTGVFSSSSEKYEGSTELMKQLYEKTWDIAKSKQQLKLFIFNLAKYGFAIGRTYPLKIVNKVKNIVSFDEENPDKSVWEEKEVVEYNDVYRENLDPYNAWLDDMAKPNNPMSVRDWCFRKVYAFDVAEKEFGKYSRFKYVKPGGITEDRINGNSSFKKYNEKELVEIYFYENKLKDLFVVIANGVPIVIEPLPISDAAGNKKLSCWHSYWTLRHAETPYGIGIYESFRENQTFLDKVYNMTMDQLVLSIYKMFFYQGTDMLTETGEITIKPGKGRQVINPQNIKWLEIPGPGIEAWKGIEMIKKEIDDNSGITPPLAGEITGKTAFEVAQAKESALKRIKIPLENICDALEQEGYITISLIDLLYSIPEVIKIVDERKINEYLKETEADQDLYERDENNNFVAKLYREFPLNLDKDKDGNLIETAETRFFRIKPAFLKWEGMINIESQSILTPSVELDKALDLELVNLLVPMIGNDPEGKIYGKLGRFIVKKYDQNPDDLLPDSWLQEQSPVPEEQPALPGQQPTQPGQQPGQVASNVGQRLNAGNQQNVGQKLIGKLTKHF